MKKMVLNVLVKVANAIHAMAEDVRKNDYRTGAGAWTTVAKVNRLAKVLDGKEKK